MSVGIEKVEGKERSLLSRGKNECSGLEVKEHSISGYWKKFSMATWGHNEKRLGRWRDSQGTLSQSLNVMLRAKGNHSSASSKRVTVSIRILTKSTQKQCTRGWVGLGEGI